MSPADPASAVPEFFRKALHEIPAYVPGRPPTVHPALMTYKISSNENPYPPLPSVLEVAARALAGMNRYPDPGMIALRERIAGELEVDAGEVVVGAGSAGVLGQIV